MGGSGNDNYRTEEKKRKKKKEKRKKNVLVGNRQLLLSKVPAIGVVWPQVPSLVLTDGAHPEGNSLPATPVAIYAVPQQRAVRVAMIQGAAIPADVNSPGRAHRLDLPVAASLEGSLLILIAPGTVRPSWLPSRLASVEGRPFFVPTSRVFAAKKLAAVLCLALVP